MSKLICIDCNKEVERIGSRQIRCIDCRKLKKLERYKKKYHNKIKLNPNFNKENYLKNRDSIRLSQKKYYLKTQDKLRLKAFEVLSNGKDIECAKHDEYLCCYNPYDKEILQIDHINNDGANQRKQIHGGNTWYRWIINNPKKARATLQIICANAQWKKRRIVEYIKRKSFKI